jgi:Ca-activated chloride channel family protein
MLEFVNPNWFWALLIILPYLAWEIFFKHKRRVRLPHSRLAILRQASGHNSWLRFLPLLLRLLVITLIIFALARPRLSHQKQEITGQGIDIMLAMDVSGSMKAVDFRPTNRLEAAKNVAKNFVDLRQNDRLGVIIFGDNAFTQCPLTLDYNILRTILDQLEIDEAANGTAIGTGLATAVARLKDSEAKSKVIILLTDGRNNAGEIDPLGAADLAKTFGIKVYPIGVGKEGLVDFPVETAFGTRYRQVEISIDMEMLHQIAQITGTARARRATNTEELQAIFAQIDQLEQTEIEIDNYYEYQELFWYFLLAALSLLFLEILLTMFLLKELP